MSAINNGSHHPFGSGRPTAVGIAHILIRSVLAKGFYHPFSPNSTAPFYGPKYMEIPHIHHGFVGGVSYKRV